MGFGADNVGADNVGAGNSGAGDVGAAYEAAALKAHAALRGEGATLAVAESLTGGLLAAALVDVPGASATFRGSVTAYATELKASVLGVDEGLLAVHGPVHPLVARQMAEGVHAAAGGHVRARDHRSGRTGSAGRTAGGHGTPRTGRSGGSRVSSPRLSGDRATIRHGAVTAALELLVGRLPSGASTH